MTINTKVEIFHSNKISTITFNNEIWFKGKDIALVLGYKRTRDALDDHIESRNKYILSQLYNIHNTSIPASLTLNQKNTIYINKLGVISLLTRSRMPNKNRFIQWFKDTYDVNYLIITRLHKEQETIGQLIQTFAHINHKTQYVVDRFRIDLYLPDHKLAIECDEFNHADRNQKDKEYREQYIKNKLNCTFIRFNPDQEQFSIFNVINEIMKKIYDPPSQPQ